MSDNNLQNNEDKKENIIQKKTVPLSAIKQIQEQQKLPIDVTILQPKVDKLNQLMSEKKPKNMNEEFDILTSKEVGLTIEEMAWLNLTQIQQLKAHTHLLQSIAGSINEFYKQ